MVYLMDRKTKGVADLFMRHLGATALGSSGARFKPMGNTLSGNLGMCG